MSAEPIFTVPNQLTLARLGLSVVLFGLIAAGQWAWCLVVFALAGLTDWLDGYLARVLKASSALGRMLDPLVDKVMMSGAFIFLLPAGTAGGWLVPWMVAVMVGREFLVTGLRGYLEQRGVAFGADLGGKVKMVLQCAALAVIFMAEAWPTAGLGPWRAGLIWAMLAATVLSGGRYVWKAAGLFTSPPTDDRHQDR